MIKKNFWRGKKVLITGHTGFKGGWLSLWLKILGAKVIGYSLNPITKKNFFNETKIKKIFKKDYRKNIKNIDDLSKCISTFRPQIVFHLAAQPQVLESYNEPLDTVKTNVIGTINLLEIARKKKFIKTIVIVTTDKVYKNLEKNIRFTENSPLGGDDVYSASKASADIITLSYIKSFFKNSFCNIATVRAGNCIGGGDWTKFRILTDSVEAFLNNKLTSVTIPNSVIANSKIINESGGPEEMERVRVNISVAYGTDIEKVRSLLMNIATSNSDVCSDPLPRVRFREFGDSALIFQLLFWIEKPEMRGRVVDAVNTIIYNTFMENNIEIPFAPLIYIRYE